MQNECIERRKCLIYCNRKTGWSCFEWRKCSLLRRTNFNGRQFLIWWKYPSQTITINLLNMKTIKLIVLLLVTGTIFQSVVLKAAQSNDGRQTRPVSYTHLRAHETRHDLVC